MTADCLQILKEAIATVNPESAIRMHCVREGNLLHIGRSTDKDKETYNLDDYDKILVVAFGKASSGMATTLVRVLLEGEEEHNRKDLPALSGIVIVKDDHASPQQVELLQKHNIDVQEASHPVPDSRSVAATQQALQMVQEAADKEARTLVLVCISGGGSALFCAPHPRLTLQDLQDVNAALLQSGLEIQQMNAVRKKLEVAKGGGLLRAAAGNGANGTTLVSLILSDVIGDPLDLIASGPTVPDAEGWDGACSLAQSLQEQGLFVPPAVLQLLQEGKEGSLPADDPKQATLDAATAGIKPPQTCLVGNNALAVERASQVAHELGYFPHVIGTECRGNAQEWANNLVQSAESVQQSSVSELEKRHGPNASLPMALIAGGETTVTIPAAASGGKGGRNQHLALWAAWYLRHGVTAQPGSTRQAGRNIVVASVGTDGTDGPTDAAGAVVDGGTVARLGGPAAEEALHAHDSYHYLDRRDDANQSPLIRLGPTGTNVADLMIALVDAADN